VVAAVDGAKAGIFVAKLALCLRLVEGDKFSKFTLFQDNTSAISIITSGEGVTAKSKHFLVRFGHLKDLIDHALMDLIHCPTEDMLPDYLTKPLPTASLFRLLRIVMGWPLNDLA
jgi:hypothetical protein